jgi:Matrixin
MIFRSLIRKLFGNKQERSEVQRPIDIARTTPRDMHAANGTMIPGGIGVMAVYADDGSPAANVALLASVIKGSGTFGGSLTRKTITTGSDGTVAVNVEMAAKGYSLYEVALAANPRKSVFFSSCTNEMTAQIFLYTEPCQPASQGQIEVEISAIDFDGNPVSGASLDIEAHSEEVFDLSSVSGTVSQVAPGRYRGIIRNDKAGAIMLLSQDMNSKVTGQMVVNVLPGPPHHFQVIGNTDPRAKKPYGFVNVQVQLQDASNNPLPPGSIRAQKADGTNLPAVLQDRNAFFKVEAVGYQYISISLSDSKSRITDEITVVFAATWLSNPGIIFTGNQFTTALFVTPRPDSGTDHGTVNITFDPKLATFIGFKPSGLLDFTYESKLEGNQLMLNFKSEKYYPTNDFPEGMYLGDITWNCEAEGTTCFALQGRMSPTTDPWNLCVEQKKRRNDCICINVISVAGDAAGLAAGNAFAANVTAMLSSAANVARCCPVLTVNRSNATITQAQLNAIVGADGTVNTRAEQNALHADTTGAKANCINIRSVPIAIPVPAGTVTGNTDVAGGNIILAPSNTDPNVGAHEVGHALGLSHTTVAGSLMSALQPHGSDLSAEECKTIFQNIGKYKC